MIYQILFSIFIVYLTLLTVMWDWVNLSSLFVKLTFFTVSLVSQYRDLQRTCCLWKYARYAWLVICKWCLQWESMLWMILISCGGKEGGRYRDKYLKP